MAHLCVFGYVLCVAERFQSIISWLYSFAANPLALDWTVWCRRGRQSNLVPFNFVAVNNILIAQKSSQFL